MSESFSGHMAAAPLVVLLALTSCAPSDEPEPEETVTEDAEESDEQPGERTPPGGVSRVDDADLPGEEHEMFYTEGDELADGYGWVDGGLSFFGATEDISDDYLDDVPPAEDPQTIAEGVAERHGEPWREDVTGMPDDSGAGARLFFTVEDTGDGYELVQVERTSLCHRGVSDDGLCM